MDEIRKEQNRLRTAYVKLNLPNDLAKIRREQDRLRTASVRASETEAEQKLHSKHHTLLYTANKELLSKRYLNFA